MPIYEYQCNACGHEMEALQRMSDAPLTDCPACHKAGLRKKISAAAFRLKGGGWYETDFKTGSNKKNLAGDAAASKGQGKEGQGKEGKGQSKKADKPASKPATAG